jgi:hypothetical protein
MRLHVSSSYVFLFLGGPARGEGAIGWSVKFVVGQGADQPPSIRVGRGAVPNT